MKSVMIYMSNHTRNPNFRYSNDNMSSSSQAHDYPSQQEINKNISDVDPINKKQTPNSNYKTP